MAIAYFIPDQAQLLARSNQQSNGQQANNNSTESNRRSPSATSRQQQQEQQQQHRSQFRANITVPLGSQQGAMSMSEFGCWELLAQIFCYALRLYSHQPRRSTVIQISFEICPGSEETATPTTTTDPVAVPRDNDDEGDVTDDANLSGKQD
ncbi:uncharacterized protein Dwil_GK11571 [Drosophila willistoni]|uniref:Cell death protein Grim n=1 Tax=Drosophila willistoni TaxID=7260 RepID=B4N457_DROWI|nr:cell death protein Grim [Drosophila willistoni]EDW78931.1 uncharacterized protein Dwil_GK11571 [Drosophila willistoni]